ncbi:hypothetical protein [Plantactinospora sonchi]|uniref:Uncharacterized protein n=1 Tax=Plantactinospora sonchi TaxID=1544735 RepID=A0ABU7RPR0_9ACTN
MTDTDGHVWRTRSRHRTSEGTVHYQYCHCGLWRVRAGQRAVARIPETPVRPVDAPPPHRLRHNPSPGTGRWPAAETVPGDRDR